MLADFLDAAAPTGQQQHDGSAHIGEHGAIGNMCVRFEQLLGITAHRRVGKLVALVQIRLGADDAVELLVELHAWAKQLLVRGEVARWRVLKAHEAGLPIAADQLTDGSHHDAQRQLHTLPGGLVRASGQQQLPNQHAVVLFLDGQGERAVQLREVLHQQAEGIPQRRLIANQQAHGAHVGQQTRARHAQAKALVARHLGAGVQQAPYFVDRNHQIGLVQHAGTQTRVEQHARSIQPRSGGHFGVIGQTGCTNERRHGNSPNYGYR